MATTHVPPRFREDNTEGYSLDELVVLNRRFEQEVDDTAGAQLAPPETNELAFKRWLDLVAAAVQGTFDDERADQPW